MSGDMVLAPYVNLGQHCCVYVCPPVFCIAVRKSEQKHVLKSLDALFGHPMHIKDMKCVKPWIGLYTFCLAWK